jgi:hypothetical protein
MTDPVRGDPIFKSLGSSHLSLQNPIPSEILPGCSRAAGHMRSLPLKHRLGQAVVKGASWFCPLTAGRIVYMNSSLASDQNETEPESMWRYFPSPAIIDVLDTNPDWRGLRQPTRERLTDGHHRVHRNGPRPEFLKGIC